MYIYSYTILDMPTIHSMEQIIETISENAKDK